jgi:preprotein translocase YajC subunit
MTSLQLMMQLIVFSTVALGIVYFLFYRPTVEAQRKARRVIADLQVGDEVVTTSGFYGRVVEVGEAEDGTTVVGLDLGGITVRARVTAIAELLQRAEPEARGAEEPRGAPTPPQPLTEGRAQHHAQ